MSVLFKHLRAQDQFGNISPKGGMTIAVEGMTTDVFIDSVSKILSGERFVLKTGMSVCSEKDSFKRQTGRELAVTRLQATTLQPVAVMRNELMCLIVGTKTVLVFALTPRNNVILTRVLQDS